MKLFAHLRKTHAQLKRIALVGIVGGVCAVLGCTPPVSASEQRIRQAVVAGQFYPGQAAELEEVVLEYLAQAVKQDVHGSLRALVVPHAGYIYSGPTAAYAYKQIDRPFRRVVILASNHSREADFEGISVPDFTHYATPLGTVPVAPLARKWRELERVTYDPAAHTTHVIEVHLPFLQMVLREEFEILPIITGRMDWNDVVRFGQLLNPLADDETLLIVSTDLSHYHGYEEAVQLDTACATAIEQLDTQGVIAAELCGKGAALIVMEVAKQHGWQGQILDYRNSGDTAGDKRRVVGYAALAFTSNNKENARSETGDMPTLLNEKEQRVLLDLARRTVELFVQTGTIFEPNLQQIAAYPKLLERRGAFVTLKNAGRLRGCIGDLIARQPLYFSVRENALQAAAKDPRFPPVTTDELAELTVSVSVLNMPRRFQADSPAAYLEQLTPHDGVIIASGNYSATYLPQVWEQLPEPAEFLSRLCHKAGVAPDCWRDPQTQIYTYQAQEFGEHEEERP